MVARMIFYMLSLFFLSCIPTERLPGGSKVPQRGYVFKNTKKINKSVYEVVDTLYFYKLTGTFFSDKSFNKTRNDEFNGSTQRLQFYQNGRIRMFSEKSKNANPNIIGRRGIIYADNKVIKIDITVADQNGSISIDTYTIKVFGDKLYLLENNTFFLNNNETMCFVYEKSDKIPKDWKQYKADW